MKKIILIEIITLFISGICNAQNPIIQTKFTADPAPMYREGNIELRLYSLTGKLIGICEVDCTGGKKKWEMKDCAVEGATGVHDLYLIFTGKGKYPFFNFDWWQFKQ